MMTVASSVALRERLTTAAVLPLFDADASSIAPVTHVTVPFMPPLSEYLPFLEQIWANKWLTNSGPFHEQLESELARHLGVEHISLVANGTIALWLALTALGVKDEVITTPFTFVATAHALRLAGATPVFVDIDPATGNLDPERVEAAITSRTSAILPVHCFGQPCRTDEIAAVASAHGLQVIYDAAHAFDVKQAGGSVLRHGDAATLSFHATKVFNTFEGGAVVVRDRATKDGIDRLRNFGFQGETVVATPSLNGKMNELQAAFGLLQLRYVDAAIARRSAVDARYRAGLARCDGIEPLVVQPDWTLNHGYFPILVQPSYGESRDRLWQRLTAIGCMARRYFHPLIADMPGYCDLPSAQTPLPVARRFAAEVLCLPIHTDVSERMVDRTLAVINAR